MSKSYGRALRRFAPWLTIVAVYLLLGFVTRLVLWAQFGSDAEVVFTRLPWVVFAGVVNDFIESLYLFAPLALYILLVPDRWFRSRANRVLLHGYTAVAIAGLLYLMAAEYFFFEEFDARFNIVAYDYLAYPTEVFTDIWEAYPVIQVLLAAITIGVIGTVLLRSHLQRGVSEIVSFRDRLAFCVPYAIGLVLAASIYPTDALSLSHNRVENELVQNGSSSFFRAARTSDIDYRDWYATQPMATNLKVLERQLGTDGARFTQLSRRRLNRQHLARPDGLGKLNVVVVSSESFGAEFSKLHGSKKDWTPNFDAYARHGIWFSNTYASGTRTVRGLEAITASFPPIPTVSILRRPGNQGIATWGSVMHELGYQTSFLYGGFGYFDDMSTFFEGNGFEVLDRTSISRQVRFENVWGVSDEDLFDLAMRHFGVQYASGKPFFSIVMTTSNHKPFTFRPGLEGIGVPEQGGGRKAGVKYADYALGRFLREAAKQPWFDDTVFVVVADHGARAYGKAEVPLQTYEIPLMIYAPKHIAPHQVDTLMTQIDIAPTVLGLLGLPYEAPFFGVDVLHAAANEERIALFSHNHDVAILRGDVLGVLQLGKGTQTLRYDRATEEFVPVPEDSGLLRLGIAYFQTAAELFKTHHYE